MTVKHMQNTHRKAQIEGVKNSKHDASILPHLNFNKLKDKKLSKSYKSHTPR